MQNSRFLLHYRLIALGVTMLLWASAGYSQAIEEFNTGKAFAQKYQIDSAYKHMQNAVRGSSALPDRTQAMIFVHYGKLLKLKEKTDSSFFYYNRSLETYKKHKVNDSILFVTASIAEVFRFRDNKDKALYYIKEAEKMLTPKTSPNILAYYYNRRAGIENQFASNDYARRLSEKVLAMQDKVNDKETVAYSYNELGALYEAGDRDQSYTCYIAALGIAERYNLLIPKADILVNLGRIAPTTDEKIERLEEAYSLSRLTGNLDMQFRISNLLFWPYKEKGDYKKAFEYCYLALYLEEKMYDSRALAKTAEIERKYNLDKAQEELRHKNAEIRSTQKTVALSVIIAALALAVLLVVAYYYRRTKKNNRMLALLSEENEFLLGEANHRMNNNLQLITIMISDELRKQPDNHATLHKILSKVESIALLHRHLYKAGDKRRMNVGKYLTEVLDNFSVVFAEQGIRTEFRAENIFLPNEDAIYMGLLVTELCINTIKHAFAGQKDKRATFEFIYPDDLILFRFSDNGQNVIGKEIYPVLVQRLCRQLKVKCTIETGNGFLFYFEKKLE